MPDLDMVVIGELNVDAIFDNLQGMPVAGTEKLAGDFQLVLGSSSAIIAANMARLGVDTGFIGKIGNDHFGRFALDQLQDSGVDTSQIKLAKELQTGITVVLNQPHERAMVTYMGAMKELRMADIDFDNLQGARHLHLSSYYLQPGLRPDCCEIFKRARKMGMTTSLDTNWDPLEEWSDDIYKVFRYVNIFLPNETEAMAIGHSPTVETALSQLASHVDTVVIKCGSHGAIARAGAEEVRVEALPVVPVDLIGAGDSFNAGFLAKHLAGGNLETCVNFGNLCGAWSTQKAGGTAAFRDQAGFKQFVEAHASAAHTPENFQTPVLESNE